MAKPGFEDHRKWKRLMKLLPDELPVHLMGHLEALWKVGYKDGNPYLGSAEDVELCAEWDGNPGVLCKALLECGGNGEIGLIEESLERPNHYQIHDLMENAPDFVQSRYRMRRYREKKRLESELEVAQLETEISEQKETVALQLRNRRVSPSPTPSPALTPTPALSPAPAPQGSGFASANPRASGDARLDRSADIRQVFDHYRAYHPKAYPTPKSESVEWRKIASRLKEGYSVEDLCVAIDGCHRSPWHCGENPGQKTYQSLSLIMRDGSHVQQFLDVPLHQRVLSQSEMRTARAARNFLEREEP